MSAESLNLTPQVYNYLHATSLREPEVLQKLREMTQKLPAAQMQISPEQGQFMGLLVELLAAKKTLDIGTFTGYSALAVALALPKDGKVISCDIDPVATKIAKEYWDTAGVANKITLHLGPALQTLDTLIEEGEAGTFDFAFIDADKARYAEYYEKALILLRSGGVVAIDNVLWEGKVADPNAQDTTTKAIRALNAKLRDDERVTLSMLPIGDGLTLAKKR